jgi:folate-binding protein YgfZ
MSSPVEGSEQFLKDGGVADLSDRVQLRLTGTDRVRYLNGQVTINVLRLEPGKIRAACITTAKGKLCADVFVRAERDALVIDADASLKEALPARLGRYIIADDVAIDDVSGQIRLVHLLGPAATRADLTALPGAARANRFGRAGLDLRLTSDEFHRVWNALSTETCVLDEPLLESLRIEAGIPRWGYELDEATLPPEARLDRTHIDYDKGCYVGQEVISRLKSVGHVNRCLTGFVAATAGSLATGLRLFHPDDTTREIGELTSTAWSFALDRPIALGYLKRGSPTGELLARAPDESGAGRFVLPRDLPLVS